MKQPTYDFSQSLLDYEGNELPLAQSLPNAPIKVATYYIFTLRALSTAYEGENLGMEGKAFRIALSKKLRGCMTAVPLTITERAVILELISRTCPSPVVYERFEEFLSDLAQEQPSPAEPVIS